MGTILRRLSVGYVGVAPGILALSTDLTNAEIMVSGFLNLVAKNTDITPLPTDFVFSTASDGNAIYTITVQAGGNIVLVPSNDGESLPNGVQLFVSKQIGNDTSGTGSYNKPFASFTKAIQQAASATFQTYIIGLDGAVYNEQLVVNNPYINIIAPQAFLNYTGSGDAITYTASQYNSIKFYAVQSSMGNAFTCTATGGAIAIQDSSFIQGNIVNSGTTELFVAAGLIDGTVHNSGGGSISYVTQRRIGTDIGNVVGSYDAGTLGSWGVSGKLTDVLSGTASFNISSPAITHTNLASAAKVNIITAPTATAQYQLTNILVSGASGTDFGGPGDRDLAITDGTNVYTVIPAATLEAIGGSNGLWGSTVAPLPTAINLNQSSVAGTNLYAQYSGGTADYTSGSLIITLQYSRVTV